MARRGSRRQADRRAGRQDRADRLGTQPVVLQQPRQVGRLHSEGGVERREQNEIGQERAMRRTIHTLPTPRLGVARRRSILAEAMRRYHRDDTRVLQVSAISP